MSKQTQSKAHRVKDIRLKIEADIDRIDVFLGRVRLQNKHIRDAKRRARQSMARIYHNIDMLEQEALHA